METKVHDAACRRSSSTTLPADCCTSCCTCLAITVTQRYVDQTHFLAFHAIPREKRRTDDHSITDGSSYPSVSVAGAAARCRSPFAPRVFNPRREQEMRGFTK